MELDLSDDQEFFRSTTRKFLDAACPLTEVRRLEAEPAGYEDDYWRQGAELGWTSSHEHIFATDAKSSIIKHQYPDNLPGTFPRDYVVSEGTAALKLLCAQCLSRIGLNNMQRSSMG